MRLILFDQEEGRERKEMRKRVEGTEKNEILNLREERDLSARGKKKKKIR